MASCGSEEEQSSCCPRGYIASGPSSLALQGYIHWRSQRPASTPSCGRHSKGQRRRPGPGLGPSVSGPELRCAGRRGAPLSSAPGAWPQPVFAGGSSVRSHTALGLLLCSCIYSEAGGDRFAAEPRGTRFSRAGRRALLAAAGCRETRFQVLPSPPTPCFFNRVE